MGSAAMPLPDVSGFPLLPAARWRALGARLRDLGIEEAYARISSIGGQMFPPLCLPLRRWHLLRMASPAASAARLFALEEALPEAEVRRVLGDLTDDLASAGLLDRDDAGLVRAR